MKQKEQIFTGIDLGNSTIKVGIGRVLPDDTLELLSVAEQPSLKMRRGVPVSPEIVGEQLTLAVEEALRNGGFRKIPGCMGIILSGQYIHVNLESCRRELDPNLAIDQELFESEMRRDAQVIKQGHGGEACLLNILHRCVRLDEGRVVFNPIGLYSSSMETESFYFTANKRDMSAVLNTYGEAIPGCEISNFFYAPVATAAAVCEPSNYGETLDLVIDLGAGMTSVIMPTPVGYFFCEQLPVGCDHIANDLSIGLDISIHTAQNILRNLDIHHFTAIATHDGNARIVDIQQEGTDDSETRHRKCSADAIETILEARLREIFELIRQRMEEQGAYQLLGNDILLSGGGATIPRITELAANVFKQRRCLRANAYQVAPLSGFGMHPRFHALLGLLRALHRDSLISQAIRSHRNLLDALHDSCRNFWHAIFDW